MATTPSYNTYDNDDHYFHQDAKYIEPDYYANNANRNMPVLSTIGRGPRGDGILAEVVAQSEDTFIYRIVDEVTGETVFQSPNLHAGRLTVSQTDANPEEGVLNHAVFTLSRGGLTEAYDVTIPAGSTGSRVYTAPDMVPRADLYQWAVKDLMFDDQAAWVSKPIPRPSDIVMFSCNTKSKAYLGVGVIQAVEAGQTVVTAQTYVELISPHIGENGNWWIGDFDTGVKAQGPKGDKGTFSAPVAKTLEYTEKATVRDTDSDPTNAALEFGIPQGHPGVSLNMKPTVYTPATVPTWEEAPFNTCFCVDVDGLERHQLWIRGKAKDVTTAHGYTVIPNWSGKGFTMKDDAVVETLDPGTAAYVFLDRTEMPEDDATDVQFNFGIPKGHPANMSVDPIVDVLPVGTPGEVSMVKSEPNDYLMKFKLPHGEDGKSVEMQRGVLTPDNLPVFENTTVNYAYVVNDGLDKQYDLYIRGREAVPEAEGGPWTIVKDWQGVPGEPGKDGKNAVGNSLISGNFNAADNPGYIWAMQDINSDPTIKYIYKFTLHVDQYSRKVIMTKKTTGTAPAYLYLSDLTSSFDLMGLSFHSIVRYTVELYVDTATQDFICSETFTPFSSQGVVVFSCEEMFTGPEEVSHCIKDSGHVYFDKLGIPARDNFKFGICPPPNEYYPEGGYHQMKHNYLMVNHQRVSSRALNGSISWDSKRLIQPEMINLVSRDWDSDGVFGCNECFDFSPVRILFSDGGSPDITEETPVVCQSGVATNARQQITEFRINKFGSKPLSQDLSLDLNNVLDVTWKVGQLDQSFINTIPLNSPTQLPFRVRTYRQNCTYAVNDVTPITQQAEEMHSTKRWMRSCTMKVVEVIDNIMYEQDIKFSLETPWSEWKEYGSGGSEPELPVFEFTSELKIDLAKDQVGWVYTITDTEYFNDDGTPKKLDGNSFKFKIKPAALQQYGRHHAHYIKVNNAFNIYPIWEGYSGRSYSWNDSNTFYDDGAFGFSNEREIELFKVTVPGMPDRLMPICKIAPAKLPYHAGNTMDNKSDKFLHSNYLSDLNNCITEWNADESHWAEVPEGWDPMPNSPTTKAFTMRIVRHHQYQENRNIEDATCSQEVHEINGTGRWVRFATYSIVFDYDEMGFFRNTYNIKTIGEWLPLGGGVAKDDYIALMQPVVYDPASTDKTIKIWLYKNGGEIGVPSTSMIEFYKDQKKITAFEGVYDSALNVMTFDLAGKDIGDATFFQAALYAADDGIISINDGVVYRGALAFPNFELSLDCGFDPYAALPDNAYVIQVPRIKPKGTYIFDYKMKNRFDAIIGYTQSKILPAENEATSTKMLVQSIKTSIGANYNLTDISKIDIVCSFDVGDGNLTLLDKVTMFNVIPLEDQIHVSPVTKAGTAETGNYYHLVDTMRFKDDGSPNLNEATASKYRKPFRFAISLPEAEEYFISAEQKLKVNNGPVVPINPQINLFGPNTFDGVTFFSNDSFFKFRHSRNLLMGDVGAVQNVVVCEGTISASIESLNKTLNTKSNYRPQRVLTDEYESPYYAPDKIVADYPTGLADDVVFSTNAAVGALPGCPVSTPMRLRTIRNGMAFDQEYSPSDPVQVTQHINRLADDQHWVRSSTWTVVLDPEGFDNWTIASAWTAWAKAAV